MVRNRIANRIGLAPAMFLLLVVAANDAVAQSGENPMVDPPEIVIYNRDSTTSPPTYHAVHGKNWWFGQTHVSGDNSTTYTIPQVDLEYGVFKPSVAQPSAPGDANVEPNNHAVVSILSGGFKSSQFNTMMGPGAEGMNLARAYLREGYELILVKHGDVLEPGTGGIQPRQPAFLPNDLDHVTGNDYGLFAQVHHAIRHIRLHRPHLMKLGATGTSSGGALAVSLLLTGGQGPNPSSDPIDALSSTVDAATAGGLGLDLLNWRYPGDQAFFFQIPEYFVHPSLTQIENPHDLGVGGPFGYPAPPTDPLHNELYKNTPWGLGVHKHEHPSPDLDSRAPFPAWNWVPGVANGALGDTPGHLVDPQSGVDPVSGQPVSWNVQYPTLSQPPASMMGTPTFSNPLLLHHGTDDGQVPYYQFEQFLSVGIPSFSSGMFQPVSFVDGNHGGRDPDHEGFTMELAWFRKHLVGRDDMDSDGLLRTTESGDPTAVPPFPGIGTDPSDPDTDGDGLVDGAEARDNGTPQLSDPLNPADGLRIVDFSRPAQSAVAITTQEPAGHAFVIQTGTTLNKLDRDAHYEWTDIEYFVSMNGTTNQQVYVTTLPALDPNGTNHAIFFRVRHETSEFDWISCDPVGISVVEIKRATSGSIRNYISPSLVGREARGKLVSTSLNTTNNTADINLAMPLAFDLTTPLNNLQSLPANEKYVAIVIRDPLYAPERAFDNAPTTPISASDYDIPVPEESGTEGHWWPVAASSGGTAGGGDTTVTVDLRTGGTDPTAIPVGSTIAIRRLSSLQDVLGPIGGPESPFKVGDEIELYGPEGVVGRNGTSIPPVEVLEFTDPTPSTPGTATWIIKGSSPPAAVALSDRLLMPDEAFGYVAFQSQNGSSKAAMVGWVPMGDINAYIAPVDASEFDITVIKNYPYPMDCPEEVFGVAHTSMGLVESSFTDDAACLVKFPWPDGVGPSVSAPKPQGDDGLDVDGNGGLVFGAPSVTRLESSDMYWVGPPDPYWSLGSPGVSLVKEANYFLQLALHENGVPPQSLEIHMKGAVLPKGRGRCFYRLNANLLALPGFVWVTAA